VGKRIDFGNNILFFEEDFYRNIHFHTFERQNFFRLKSNIGGRNKLSRKNLPFISAARTSNKLTPDDAEAAIESESNRRNNKIDFSCLKSTKTQNGKLLLSNLALMKNYSEDFKHKSRKYNKELDINGDFYRIGDLFNHNQNRRQTSFFQSRNCFSQTMQKPQDEITIMNKRYTEIRMENRRNEVIKKIILQSSNENSPGRAEDEATSDNDMISLSKGFSSTLNKRLNSLGKPNESFLDSEYENILAERRKDNLIEIGKFDSTAKLNSMPFSKAIIEESKSESDPGDQSIRDNEVKFSESRNKSDPYDSKFDGKKLMKKATLKLLESQGKNTMKYSSLFGITSKFQDAVKLQTNDGTNKLELRHFKSFLFKNRIISKSELNKKQLEVLSKFATGYSYAIDVEEDKFIRRHIDGDNSLEVLFQQVMNITKPRMSKAFIFTKADFSKVTNDEEEFKKDENVMNLLKLIKFSNKKREVSLNNFKESHCLQIKEILDEDKWRDLKIKKMQYQFPKFYNKSFDLVIHGKAQKRLKGDLGIDEIYQFHVSHQINISFSGIISSITNQVYQILFPIFL
jgi:hypothetical protein